MKSLSLLEHLKSHPGQPHHTTCREYHLVIRAWANKSLCPEWETWCFTPRNMEQHKHEQRGLNDEQLGMAGCHSGKGSPQNKLWRYIVLTVAIILLVLIGGACLAYKRRMDISVTYVRDESSPRLPRNVTIPSDNLGMYFICDLSFTFSWQSFAN